jgi:hypothetical protein
MMFMWAEPVENPTNWVSAGKQALLVTEVQIIPDQLFTIISCKFAY